MAAEKMTTEPVVIETADGLVTITAEIAVTPEQQSRGLMFRTRMPATSGMLFTYAPAQEITMWMANTPLSLDMVFIRSDGVIHRIARRTEPFSRDIIASYGDVTAVLEIKGGQSRKLGIAVGDRVRHAHFGTAD